MNYVDTVLDDDLRRKHLLPLGGGQPARLQVVVEDPFGVFTNLTLRDRPRHIFLVSPWLSSEGLNGRRLQRLARHARGHRSLLTLVTRPTSAAAHDKAIEAVVSGGGTVALNAQLHAKLYLCERHGGGGLAVIGSANMTNRSLGLAEVAVLVRSTGRSRVIRDLKGAARRRFVPGPFGAVPVAARRDSR